MKRAFEKITELSAVTVVAVALMTGLGAAALLSTYGSVTGDADVQQSVTFADGGDDDTTFFATYDGELVAGSSTVDYFVLENNAGTSATVEFVSDADSIEGVDQFVREEDGYEQQTLGLYEGEQAKDEYAANLYEDGSSFSVDVDPSEDAVTYTVPKGDSHFETVVSPNADGEADNYEVTYRDGGDGWLVAPATDDENETLYGDSTEDLVDEWDFVQSLEDNGDEVVVAYERDADSDQAIQISIRQDGDRYYTSEAENGLFPDRELTGLNVLGFDNSYSDVTNHEVDLDPNSESTFELATTFDVSLDPNPEGEDYFDGDYYNIDLDVVPVTESNNG